MTVFFLEGGRPTFGPRAAELTGEFYKNLWDRNYFVGKPALIQAGLSKPSEVPPHSKLRRLIQSQKAAFGAAFFGHLSILNIRFGLTRLCTTHRGLIAMSGPRSLAVHSDSISTTPRMPVA